MFFLSLWFFPALLPLVLASALPQTAPATASCDQSCKIDKELPKLLSSKASVVHTSVNNPRWSELDAPNPSTVVNVATESDVAITVGFIYVPCSHTAVLITSRYNTA